MKPDLTPLDSVTKLLFAIDLQPIQGARFQPTGFPSLGAATYQTKQGTSLLVESPQSMANRLENTVWDEANEKLKSTLNGISYVRVEKQGNYLTSSITEAHRLNSPYMLEGSDKTFANTLKTELSILDNGPINRKLLAQTLLKFDINSLLHGIFLAKKDLAGGRLRIARALSAFIEAEQVNQAVSGGVKNDHVNPSGSAKDGFGNVPFSREEYTAEKITLYVNLDLAQIRGYGLGNDVEHLLILLALFKLRTLLDGDLRLRTACDLIGTAESIVATQPKGFTLPSAEDLAESLAPAIAACKDLMTVTTVSFNDDLKQAKDADKDGQNGDNATDDNHS
jgi:CRISPR-associated protein Csb1